MSSAICYNLDQSKILSSGRVLSSKQKCASNIVGKGENASDKYFLHHFFNLSQNNLNFAVIYLLSSANAFRLALAKILSSDRKLNDQQIQYNLSTWPPDKLFPDYKKIDQPFPER